MPSSTKLVFPPALNLIQSSPRPPIALKSYPILKTLHITPTPPVSLPKLILSTLSRLHQQLHLSHQLLAFTKSLSQTQT
jgi:hypothetical protein